MPSKEQNFSATVNVKTIYSPIKETQSATLNWMAFDKITGEEVRVIYDVKNKCVTHLINDHGDLYECEIERLVDQPPFEFTPDNDCASDWEKEYLSSYTDFHLQAIGPIGIDGVQGPKGPTGDQGAIGGIGAQGVIGDQGPVGETGNIGPAGAAGLNGLNGQCTGC